MKFLRLVFTSLAAAAWAAASAQALAAPDRFVPSDAPLLYAPQPANKTLYSFADVYRLTVAGATVGELAPASSAGSPAITGYQMRTVAVEPVGGAQLPAAAAPAPQAAAYVFSIAGVPQPERWLLIVSGLALAAWVARRRLGYSIQE
jgi:hypothetical protein